MEHKNFLLVLASRRDSELNWDYIMDFVYLATYAMDTFYKSETNVNKLVLIILTQRFSKYLQKLVTSFLPQGSALSAAGPLMSLKFPSTFQGY